MEADYPSLHDEAKKRFTDHPTWKMLRHTPWENDAPIIAAELARDAVAVCLERVRQLEEQLADTRSGSQGVVTEEMVEAAIQELDFSSPESRTHMRAALLAAMGGRGDGWISCSERMPEDGQMILFYDTHWQKVTIGLHEDGNWLKPGFSGLTTAPAQDIAHWMPLPPPPTTISEERP